MQGLTSPRNRSAGMRTVILFAATFNTDARTLKVAPLRDPRDPIPLDTRD
jgi:hypothetical protein